MMRNGCRVRICCAALVVAGAIAPAGAQEERRTPYWASIAASEALMRTGPGANYPGVWLYRRSDLPIRVVARHQSWRKVEEPDGTQGWMAVILLSDRRTGIVRGGVRPLRDAPDPAARVTWRMADGVIGHVSDCAEGWCRFDVEGRAGYVETTHIWGVDAREVLE